MPNDHYSIYCLNKDEQHRFYNGSLVIHPSTAELTWYDCYDFRHHYIIAVWDNLNDLFRRCEIVIFGDPWYWPKNCNFELKNDETGELVIIIEN